MANETPAPLPLTGEEVRIAVLHKLDESLSRTCHLHADAAYTAFTAKITVELTLSDYGREQKDNHIVAVGEGELPPDAQPETHEITVEPAPPNQVRVDTGQDIPVRTVEDGKPVIKKVKYQPRVRK